MSANFVFAKFPRFEINKARREAFKRVAKLITPAEWEEFDEWHSFELDHYGADDLLKDIEEVCSIDSSEIAIDTNYSTNGEKYEVSISGGITWGEDPTAVYSIMVKASFFTRIYNLAKNFAIEEVVVRQMSNS